MSEDLSLEGLRSVQIWNWSSMKMLRDTFYFGDFFILYKVSGHRLLRLGSQSDLFRNIYMFISFHQFHQLCKLGEFITLTQALADGGWIIFDHPAVENHGSTTGFSC